MPSTASTIIVTTPNQLSPMNNLYGSYWQLSNTNYTNNNMKYINQLYYYPNPILATYSFMVQENVPPRPNTGYGLYSPYQSLLSLLSYDLNFGITYSLGTTFSLTLATNSIVKYQIGYGIDYNPGLTFTVDTGASPAFGFFYLDFEETTYFETYDLITIQTANPNLNGQTIAEPYSFTISATPVPWVYGSTASMVYTGFITDLQRFEGFSGPFWGYNGTRQYGQQNINYYDTIVHGVVTGVNWLFSTDYPLGTPVAEGDIGQYPKLIMPFQYETLSLFILPHGFAIGPTVFFDLQYSFYNSAGVLLTTYTAETSASASNFDTLIRVDIPVGTANLYNIPAGTEYYTVYDISPSSGYTSETRTYQIDNNCYWYENVRLMWVNSYGAFDFFNFRLDNKKTYNMQRNEYNQILPVNYITGQPQKTVLSTQVTEQHLINTDWVNEEIYAFLGQILISPQVYVINELTNTPYPIVIVDTNYEFKTTLRDRLFQLSLTYEHSYEVETQKQ